MSTTYKGTANNDVLPSADSPVGADSLLGGKGDDTYNVDAGDVVLEKLDEGIDQVLAVVSYTLPANVESLRLMGTANLNGTGNDLDNRIVGNDNANVLDGMGGVDTLLGAGGSDVFKASDLGFSQIDGGVGVDTLALTGSGLTLDLAAMGDRLQNLEAIRLGANNLMLTLDSVVALSSSSDSLRIDGSAAATVDLDSGWQVGADSLVGGVAYHTYTQGSVGLQVDARINTVRLTLDADSETGDWAAQMAKNVKLEANQGGLFPDGISGNLRATGFKSPAPYHYLNSLLFTVKGGRCFYWGNDSGTTTTVTYQIETGDPKFGPPYDGLVELKTSFKPLNSRQQEAAKTAMTAWGSVAGIDFVANTDADKAGDIRWFGSDNLALVPTAAAFAPNGSLGAGAGDLWVGPKPELSNALTPGSYGYLIFLHELGHSLGLIHPHDSAYTPEAGTDSLKYTVMSYRDYAGDDLNGYNSAYYPTTPMLNDIAALQYLYGTEAKFHPGDDSYTWVPEKSVYETIWDSGGLDTIDAGNQLQEVVINLNPTQWSQIGEPFWNGDADVRDCLTIARGVVIENAVGSIHDDTLIGNTAANTLTGNKGDDTLRGGDGMDTAVYSGSFAQYNVIFSDPATLAFTIADANPRDGDDGTDTLSGVEKLQFIDRTVALPSLIPMLNVEDMLVDEGQSGKSSVKIPITLSTASAQTITVAYATQSDSAAAGSDYVAQKGTLTFAPGETEKTVSLQVYGDKTPEADETVKFMVSNPQLGSAVGTLTLRNDDPPPLTVTVAQSSFAEADGMAVFTVQLAMAGSQPVEVDYATMDGTAQAGSDYTATSGTLIIPAGATSATVSVPLIDDDMVEASETFKLRLSNPVDAILGKPATATATVQSEDAYVFTVVGNRSFAEGNDNSNDSDGAVVTVRLTPAAADYLSVDYQTQAGSATAGNDYTETSGTLAFEPGDSELSVLIPLRGDTQIEPNENFRFFLSNPQADDPGLAVALGTPNSGTVTIKNDDFPLLSVKNISVDESAANAVFTLTLDQAAKTSTAVDFITQSGGAVAGSDYVATRGTASFAIGQKALTVSVPLLNDAIVEGDESFNLVLSNPKGVTLTQTIATATIRDGTAAPSVTITSDKSYFKAGDTATLTFAFSTVPSGFTKDDVTVSGGSLDNWKMNASGDRYTVVFTPTPGIDDWSGTVGVPAASYSDAAGNNGQAAAPLGLKGDTRAPVFTSGKAASVAENTAFGTTVYDATADSDTGVTYGLSGADAALFGIDAGTGKVSLAFMPNYEIPSDKGANNVYDFTVRATDAAGNYTDQAVALTVTDVAEAALTVGQPVIDLGAAYGKLILPVNVDGKWYYYWDRNGDGTANTGDKFTHDALDGLFERNAGGAIEGVDGAPIIGSDGNSDDIYRHATLNGLPLALPTLGEAVVRSGSFRPATAVGGTPATAGSTANNATYDDLLAIWDAYNGTGTGTVVYGAPSGWPDFPYWSATNSTLGHAMVGFAYGDVNDTYDASIGYVALQVLLADSTAPVFTSAATASVAENTASGTTIYDATADGDTGVSYGLSGADAAMFTIDAGNGKVSLGFQPNFEAPVDSGADNVYGFTVRATDAAGNYTDQAVALAVTDAMEVVTAGQPVIDLGAAYGKLILPVNVDGKWYYHWDRSGDGSSADMQGIGYTNSNDYTTQDVLNTLFTQDANGNSGDGITDETYRYATLSGIKVALPTVGEGEAAFSYGRYPGTVIDNNPVGEINPTYDDLLAIWDAFNGTGAGTGDYGTPLGWGGYRYWSATPTAAGHAYVSLIVGNVADVYVHNYYVALQVLFADTSAPTISTIAITGATGLQNSTLNVGDVVSVTVNMSEAVTVTGTPQLAFNIGGGTVQASYASGSNSTALVFQYTIQANQTDANGISIAANSLSLNGGTLKDAAGNAAALTHALVADNAGYRVDTTAPALVGSSPSDNATAVKGGSDITLTFNETVKAGSGNLIISNGTDSRSIAVTDTTQVSFSGSTVTLNPTADLLGGSSYSVQMAGGVIQDLTGNAYAGIGDAASFNFTTKDTVAPVFASGTTATVAENIATGTKIYDATADGDTGVTYGLSGADAAKFTIDTNNGTVSLAFVPNYEAPVDNGGNNVYDFTVRATDTAGNYTDQAVALTVTDAVEAITAGQPVIDLGAAYGKLILPVNVEGKWYYYWDISGDGTIASTQGAGYTKTTDITTHDALDDLFYQDINGAIEGEGGAPIVGSDGNTDNTYRYATLNGVPVALPTLGDMMATTGYLPGTAVGGYPASAGSTAINPTYDDLLAIWDAYNGTGTGTGDAGVPSGWNAYPYWSATPYDSEHVRVYFHLGGYVHIYGDSGINNVALQVLFADTTAPTLSSSTPADNAVTVAANSNILLTFNEAVQAGIGNIVISDGTDIRTIAVTDTSQVSISGNTVTINPTTDLHGGSSYSVQMAGGVFNDVAGNVYAGISDATSFNFTTKDTVAPVFASGTTATVAENIATGTKIYDATADGDTGVTYGLSGADAAKFTIDTNNGTVSLAFLPDYETPIDNGGNNVYDFSVRATDAAGNFTDQVVALTVTDVVDAGQSVIDLGAAYGKLIYPVNVDGKWYYYWDRSGDGTSANTQGAGYTIPSDYTTRDVLDGIFNQDINGVTGGNGNTTDTYRYATLNGVKVALPTQGDGKTGISSFYFVQGTVIDNNPAGETNPAYDDLLAIWDAYNGTSTGSLANGTPPGWCDFNLYWSATPSVSGHTFVNLSQGLVDGDFDYYSIAYVALQVL